MKKNIIILILSVMVVMLFIVIILAHSKKVGKEEISTKKDTTILTSGYTSDLTGKTGTTSQTVKYPNISDQQKDIKIKVFQSINNTYGCDILLDNRPYIHQSCIPGLQGNDGFKTSIQAKQIAELVAKKIRNHEIPPAITIEELKKFGIIN